MADVIDGGNAFSTFEEDAPNYVGSFSGASRTVQDVALSVRRQFGDDAGVQIEDQDIIRWVNEAQDVIVNRNRILKARSVVTSIRGQARYRWPDERILQVESIHYDGIAIPNVPFPEAERWFSENSTLSGPPQVWYEWAGAFTFVPTPDAEKEIELYLTLKPTLIANLSDTLSVPDKYFSDVVRYVMLQAYEMDEDWDAVKTKQQQFDASVNELGEEERTAQNMTYPVIQCVDDWC